MRNPYYLIWVDFITSAKKYHSQRTDWKFHIFVLLTTCNALNLFTIYTWLKYFKVVTYLVSVEIFPGNILNSSSSFIVQFASPFILLNYFLIFYKKRYKQLINKYQGIKGKPGLIYSLGSVIVGFISTILYGLLS